MTHPQRLTLLFLGVVAAAAGAGYWVLVSNPSIAAATGLPDAGTLTRWGLPAAKVVRDIAMATTIGALVALTFIAPRSKPADTGETGSKGRRVLATVALASATAWVVAGVTVLVFTYSELVGIPAGSLSGTELQYFVTDFPLGKALAWNIGLATAAATILVLGRTPLLNGLSLTLALVALWPLATIGHASGALNHDHAVNSQAAHLLGVSLWFGTLLAIAVAWNAFGEDRPTIARRFSTLAGWAFALVAGSGVLAAVLRMQTWSGLESKYGALVVVKVGLLLLLGIAGLTHRRRFLAALESGQRAGFGRLVAAELVLMLAAVGAGVALGGTPPPRSTEPRLTAAESLLGYSMPGELDPGRWLTSWRPDSLWVPIGVLAIAIYLAGVLRLRGRGDKWPLGRSLGWMAGWGSMIWATSGAPGVYGDVLFSVHMVQHMTIATTAPILMVLGAPITLALRTIGRRTDGSVGPREWILLVVHSPVTRFVTHPIVAAGMFIGGMVVFYYSSLFELSLRSHTAHNLMVVHFILTGYVFASVIVGIDPGIKRPTYPLRILLVLVTFGFHALFAVSLMSSNQVLAEGWFTALNRTWGPTPLEDQGTGASIGWLLGDYPLAIIAAALIWGWVRDDTREARRFDRQAERDGGKALNDYNAFLAALKHNADARATTAADDASRQDDQSRS